MTDSHKRNAAKILGLSIALAAAGCSSLDGMKDVRMDYQNGARKTVPLEVPPDLKAIARDNRYAPQASVSAVELQQQRSQRGGNAAADKIQVAPQQAGDLRIERDGQQRWLLSSRSPEALWPQVRQFWLDQGFELIAEDPKTGVLETDWQENRAKLPKDVIRQTLGKVLDKLFDSGERDRYRVRLEPAKGGKGTEIYVTHKGLTLEVDKDERGNPPTWVTRPNEPGLEAEMLSLLMQRLGASEEAASQAVAQAGAGKASAGSAVPGNRARLLADSTVAGLVLDEPLERAWRRVGLALDRGGFAVEERDQTRGLYYVRYVDPKLASQDANFFTRLFGGDKSGKSMARYRVALKATGQQTELRILTVQGDPETSENGKRIASVLVEELK